MEVQHVFYGLDGRNPQEDIEACTNDKCQRKDTCVRWHIGTNKNPHQTHLDMECDGEFYVELKR